MKYSSKLEVKALFKKVCFSGQTYQVLKSLLGFDESVKVQTLVLPGPLTRTGLS